GGGLQGVRHGEVARPQGDLDPPVSTRPAVSPDVGVALVLARHEAGPGRGTDGAARVEIREANPFRGQTVEGGRARELLAVTPEVAIAEVVGQDEDDVGTQGAMLVGGDRVAAPGRKQHDPDPGRGPPSWRRSRLAHRCAPRIDVAAPGRRPPEGGAASIPFGMVRAVPSAICARRLLRAGSGRRGGSYE